MLLLHVHYIDRKLGDFFCRRPRARGGGFVLAFTVAANTMANWTFDVLTEYWSWCLAAFDLKAEAEGSSRFAGVLRRILLAVLAAVSARREPAPPDHPTPQPLETGGGWFGDFRPVC